MFCQLFSLQNKSFLCLQHVENKGFQTVIKQRLKAIQKPIKNELGNREKNTENAHFVLKKCTFRFRDYNKTVLFIVCICSNTIFCSTSFIQNTCFLALQYGVVQGSTCVELLLHEPYGSITTVIIQFFL